MLTLTHGFVNENTRELSNKFPFVTIRSVKVDFESGAHASFFEI